MDMVAYCIKNQLESYDKLNPGEIEREENRRPKKTIKKTTKRTTKKTQKIKIAKFCKDKWSSDRDMQEKCSAHQKKGWVRFNKYAEECDLLDDKGGFSSPLKMNKKQKIIDDCMKKWRMPEYGEWQIDMVVKCIDKRFTKAGFVTTTREELSSIESYCKTKWGDKKSMLVYCSKKQKESKAELIKLAKLHGIIDEDGAIDWTKGSNPHQKILSKCYHTSVLEQFGVVDSEMAVYCIEQQLKPEKAKKEKK